MTSLQLLAGTGTFPTFVAVSLIDSIATIILAVVLIGILIRYNKWRKVSPPNFFGTMRKSLGSKSIIRSFLSEFVDRVLLQKDLIHNDTLRRITHLAMFWGFVGLSATTTLDYIFNEPGNYVPLFGGALSPIRWLGNVSGVIMVFGATVAIGRHLLVPRFRRERTFGDVWFTVLLFLAGVTGFLAEYWGELAYQANPAISPAAAFSISLSASPLIIIPYGIHLTTVLLLLVTAPISAFIHAFTVPSMRYVDKLGNLLALKRNKPLNENRTLKEDALMDDVERHSE